MHPIQAWCRDNGVSQNELARRIKVGSSHLSYICSGKTRPSPAVALRIGDVTGISLETLYRWGLVPAGS